ncbi:MAG: winged helix-turn-helix transcriptional regulator [Actinomycetota bacterium]|nr:winged helix-turn-helix transcriptional regulator [Actinomycetota bacterium]
MALSRTYGDSCGVAHALELVGERWAMLVVRELMLSAKRFGDIKDGLPGISANVLSHRLDELERAGLVTRRKLPKPAAVWVYDLTPWARDLEPIMQTFGRWAARDPQHRKDLHFGTTSLVLSLRTNFDPSLADGVHLVVALRPNDETYVARVARKKLTIEAGEPTKADATIAGDPRAFAAVTYGGRLLADAIDAGELVVTGNAASAELFLHLYTLPPTASA